MKGSKWTDVAIALVQGLGIQALCMEASVQDLYGGMLAPDAEGALWQSAAACRSYSSGGQELSENGELALWEDSEHPTAEGAKVHFQCLVNTFRARYESLGS